METPELDDILDTLLTAVLRLDGENRIVYINPSAADLFQTSPKRARHRALRDILPVDVQLPVYLARARERGEPLALAELSLDCGPPPGQRRLVACDILPVENGGVQLEFQSLDRRLAIAEENAPLKNHQAQRLLFQALAHEIKNPLSGLRGAAQLLAAEAGDAVPPEYLDIMLRETERLRDLVDNLLGPARLPRFAALNIHAVLDHVASLLTLEAGDKLDWRRDYDPSLPELQADSDQLTQVFLNLAGNALEAMQGKGTITVRTRVERNFVSGQRRRMALRVDIDDNGPGVPENLRASLFLPLVTSRVDGTGLGLPIAQDIVERHGGIIEWHSEPGHTRFSVVLPVRAANTQDTAHD